MLDRLPVHINPLNFADKGKRLLGAIKINELTRLSEMLLEDSGEVDIDFSFDKEGRLPIVVGEIKVNLILECQSCLKQFVLPIEKHFKLGLVTSLEQADSLAGDCEPLILETNKISLNELVEDELLLALPDFPRHPYVCVEQQDDDDIIVETVKAEEQQAKPNNPFSVLAKLKNTGD